MTKKKSASDGNSAILDGNKVWADMRTSLVWSRNIALFFALLGWLVALVAVAGVVQIGSQSKYIPYVVEVDRLGQVQMAGAINTSANVDARVVHSMLGNFINNLRIVSFDTALQKRAVLSVYSMISNEDPAKTVIDEWYNATPESTPFEKAKKEVVNIEILTLLPQSNDTWQIDWEETRRGRSGGVIEKYLMRALVTVYVGDIPHDEETIRTNPLSLYIRNISWSRISDL